MRITVVGPSAQYMEAAGVRIRYRRIMDSLEDLGHTLDLKDIGTFNRNTPFDSDIYLLSKCYDARSYLAMRALKSDGRIVGIDVFDDYFDQSLDSRFVRHREWLRTMSSLCDFFLCSTPRMQSVVGDFMPDTPGHVMNDPFDGFDAPRVADLVKVKIQNAHRTGHIDVVWFGVGDNPNFDVGLKDLAAYGASLSRIRQMGLTVSLTVLTNRRALDGEGLRTLARLGVPFEVEEWTEERETALLAQCLIAFIPVNAQSFSIAKSLNRAVTALTEGAQVLSPGYPLYRPLSQFVYEDEADLVMDIRARKTRLRSATVASLHKALLVWGNPEKETAKLSDFLVGVIARQHQGRSRGLERPVGVVHGVRSPADCHKAALRLGYLSIASPFSNPKLNYDLNFVFDEHAVQAQFSEDAVRFCDPALLERMTAGTSPTGRPCRVVSIKDVLPGHPIQQHVRPPGARARASLYPEMLGHIRDAACRLIPGLDIYLSELDSPFMDRVVGKHRQVLA